MKNKIFSIRLISIVVISLGVMSWIGTAQANPVTFNFTGEVYAINSPWDSYFNIGDLVQGSDTFDSATPDTNPDPGLGLYSNT